VRIQFEGWPAVFFSGWPTVGFGTYGGRVAVVDAQVGDRGKFRALVVPHGTDPWPEERYLRQGARAQGWVLLDTVSLGYELWRRFNAFPPDLPVPPPETRVHTGPSGPPAKQGAQEVRR
jgi:hypothetical protein